MERQGEIEPLSIGKTELQPHLYTAPAIGRGQKQRIYFGAPGEEPITDRTRPDDITKVSFLVLDGDKAVFLGMALNRGLRGEGLGRHMVRYFMAHAESQELEVVGTARINKPLIGLTLQREGFQPVSEACQAEILPSQDDSLVPRIRFLHKDLPDSEVRDGYKYGKFYEVADPASVENRPVDPGKVVALHLRYGPPA